MGNGNGADLTTADSASHVRIANEPWLFFFLFRTAELRMIERDDDWDERSIADAHDRVVCTHWCRQIVCEGY